MSQKRRAAILLGFCTVLAACDGTSTDDLTGPEPTARASDPAGAAAASATLIVRQVSVGDFHKCVVATDNRAYCWGSGLIGDGTTSIDRVAPTLVKGALSFRQISAGTSHTCGVTTDNRAYCWGSGGSLGDGTTTMRRLRPYPVAGGLSFRQVSAGQEHSCGVTTDDRVYCWGENYVGQLGDGTQGELGYPELSPVAVMGTLRFRGVSVGGHHSCGVTMTDQVYCWGSDWWGQIGDGAASGTCAFPNGLAPCRKKPTLVVGRYHWRQVDAGGGQGPGEDETVIHGGRTCGVTTDGRAFCWGDGTLGQNGDGTRSIRTAPSQVAGDRSYRAISTGYFHTCALTTDDRAYCWGGQNWSGELGDGTEGILRGRPRAVVGRHLFEQISAGNGSTCARTPTGAAYCWGTLVGDGTLSHYLTPQAVGGPS